MARKARIEGAVPGEPTTLAQCVAQFKARFPAEWEALRLCPLQHGLETMIEKLNG